MTEADDFVAGFHAVGQLLRTAPGRVSQLWLSQDRRDRRVDDLLKLCTSVNVGVTRVTREALDELAGDLRHQGVLARIRSPDPSVQEMDWGTMITRVGPGTLLLVLDGVQDPHNLGACLRVADAAGVQAVIVPKDGTAPLTPVVRRAAAGAAETVPLIRVTNLARSLRQLAEAGVWVIGTSGEGARSLYEADFRRPVALVLGGEGNGMRRLTETHCDEVVSIPMKGAVESLNVSVAAGITLFEVVRQRLNSGGPEGGAARRA